LVLVDVVEVTEGGEREIVVQISPWMRLQQLDRCNVLVAEARESSTTDLPAELLRGVTDRELRCVAVIGASETRELTDEIVQHGAQIVDEVSKDQAELERRLLAHPYTEHLPSVIETVIWDDRVRFTFREGSEFRPKRVKVFARPVELRTRIT
jgi:predicted small metal-binding protein